MQRIPLGATNMNYLACAWANKLTRYGYIAILLGVWGLLLTHWLYTVPLFGVGALLLWGSELGIPTLKAFKIADRRYRRKNGLSPRLLQQLWRGGPCIMAGVDLAHRRHQKRVKKACRESP